MKGVTEMKKLKDYNGYRITPTEWGYYVVISSTKANYMITYEYDGNCSTLEDLEDYLKKHTFYEVVKDFKDQYVYMECKEQIW